MGYATASTSDATLAVVVPALEKGVLKPPPDVHWQKQAIATLQKLTPIPFVNRTLLLTPQNLLCVCPEMHLHLLDRATGDGHCGFRALSKSITGTEANHSAFREVIVAFMRCSCVGRRKP